MSNRPQMAKKMPKAKSESQPAVLIILMNLMSISEIPVDGESGRFFFIFDMVKDNSRYFLKFPN